MLFTDTHEWIKINENIATIGISSFAQKELGEIVFIELPKVGDQIAAQSEMVVLESTKAAADIYCPLSGEIVEVNHSLKENLNLLNQDPENKGWMIKIKVHNKDELNSLMSLKDYLQLIQS